MAFALSRWLWLWAPSATTTAALVAALTALAVLAALASCVRAYRRLAHVPGPWSMGVTNLVLSGLMYGGKIHYHLIRLRDEYGAFPRFPLSPSSSSAAAAAGGAPDQG